jgi:predicted DNA-binding protein
MTKRINMTISDSLYERIKGISDESGMTLSSICTMMIMTYFNQQDALSSMNNVLSKLEGLEQKISVK